MPTMNEILTKKVVIDGVTRTVLAQIPGGATSTKRKSTFVTEAEIPSWFTDKSLAKKLYHYQLEIVEHHLKALDQHGASLDASDMGVGKTFSALAAVQLIGKTPCVITLKPVIPSWRSAQQLLGTDERLFVSNYEQVKAKHSPYGYWVSPSGRQRSPRFEYSIDPKECVLIFDEVHKTSGMGTENSKLLEAAVRQKIPTIMLSGTVADEPKKLKAIGVCARTPRPKGILPLAAGIWLQHWALWFGVELRAVFSVRRVPAFTKTAVRDAANSQADFWDARDAA
jgi:hypothetical protein